MSEEKFYITTPAYYSNDVPHIGHAYSTIAADVIARWYRLKFGNENVLFVTGLDEHGSKIEKAAADRGLTPQQFVDRIADVYKDVWQKLGISYDIFRRTSDEYHVRFVTDLFERIRKAGDIYKGTYEGWYCVPCESFWTDFQLKEGKCPSCGRAVEKLTEPAYFFRLSKYQDRLLKLYEENPEFLSPHFRRQEIINRVKEGLRDLCVTRSKVKWGIQVPGDESLTIYVWIDALPFYISALEPPSTTFKQFWPPDVQIMAKEIFWFHTVIWPAILMSAGYELPKKEFAHGWLTIGGQKMSKSLGNAIDPVYLAKRYGSDALRYALIRETSFGEDGDFSEDALKTRINNELVANYSNLYYRATSFIAKNFDGKVPEGPEPGAETEAGTGAEAEAETGAEAEAETGAETEAETKAQEAEKVLINSMKETVSKVDEYMSDLRLTDALAAIMELSAMTNKYFQENEPWKKIKGNDDDRRIAARTLYTTINILRTISILLFPFMPEKCESAVRNLGSELTLKGIDEFLIKPGQTIKQEMLFKKIE
jgi:methionyl-tRNA synthetase